MYLGVNLLWFHSESIPMGIMSHGGICLPVTPWLAQCVPQFEEHRRYHSWQLVFQNPVDFTWKSGRFHEIQWISCEIQWISWNPPKNLINQITQQKLFSFMQWEGYVSWFTWNLPDFTWNQPNFMNMSFCVITKYRSFFWKTNKP